MTEPRNAVMRQYQALLARHGAALTVSGCAQRAIAAEARRRGTGARGLRSLLEDLLLDARFEAPRHASCKVVLEQTGVPAPSPPRHPIWHPPAHACHALPTAHTHPCPTAAFRNRSQSGLIRTAGRARS